MTVTRLGPPIPLINAGLGGSAGGTLVPPISATSAPAGRVLTSDGSNASYWGPNVATITSNGSNQVVGPFVNFAAGSNILLSLDSGPGGSFPSNTIRIHGQAGGAVGNILTSNGSNSLAPIINLQAGTGIALGVSGQTITVTNTGVPGPAGTTAFAGARVRNSAAIAINPSATLTFDSERYDTNAYHDTSSNTGRLTIPTGKAGKHSVGATVEWAANVTGYRQIGLRVNGTTFIAIQRSMAVTVASEESRQTIETDYDFAVGDYVEVIASQSSGGSLNITASGNYSPEFYITYEGA